MGHSKADKDASHERIVRTAAARFREKGVEGIGVADLMKDAGLTHGGFYRHFASRDDLVFEAIEQALRDGEQAVQALDHAKQPASAVLGMLVDGYLSAAHRDGVATGCAVTAMAADVARGDERTRAAYARQVNTYLGLLSKLTVGAKSKSKRSKAIAALSTLVGALSMARAVGDPALSDEILQAAASELKASLSADKPAD